MFKVLKLKSVSSTLARSRGTNLQPVGYRFQALSTNEVKPKSQLLFYVTSTILTGIVGTAGIIVYSKYDPKFRELITNNIPGSDKFIKVCLFEDKEFVDHTKQFGGRIVCKIAQQVKSIKENFIGQQSNIVDKTLDQIKSVTKSLPIITNNEDKTSKDVVLEPQQTNNKHQNKHIKSSTEQINYKSIHESTNKQVEQQLLPPAPVILPSHQYTLEELETEILKKSSLGIDALKNATESIKEYSENVYQLIESTTEKIDPNLSFKLQKLEDKKNNIFTKSIDDVKKYQKEIIEKQKILTSSKFEASVDKITKTKQRINEALEELTKVNFTLQNEENKLEFIKKYKSNINDEQASLTEEFESLFPGSDVVQHNFNLKSNDFDIFLLYALKKLNYYQDKLSKQEATLDRKINNAMGADFLNVETINEMNSRLNSEIHQLDKQFNSQLAEFNIKIDEELQKQLKMHIQAHADLVAKAVDFTKEEFENRVRHELSAIEKLERQKFQSQIDSLKSDLQSVVNNLKEQAEKEKKIFANQAIWETSEFLKSSLASSDNEQLIDIRNQIKTIKNLGESDSMVKQVVNAVPSKAIEKGVFSKGQLKENFNQVEKRVYQTALIPDNTFNLPLMMFSYITSFFVVRHSHISPSEVNNEEFNPLELNTYEIIERARYCIDRDDILLALRYLNLLTGCSRVVAKEWMKEATIFLETKQAIDLLMSYVTVTSYSAAHNA